ncbi:MAG: hypothetical protein NC203_09660 [Firmicutes bacterium]|nr:hypothetical protein [[Eubacterium] siraeum]MCM1488621.1 hypothetical protein [Bacillota bacterium]
MKIFKKAIGVILAASVLTLTGCKNSGFLAPKAPDLNKQFTFSAALNYGEEALSANFSRTDIGKWSIEITEPYQIQGVVFDINGGDITASFGGLTAEAVTPDFLSSSVVSAIVKAMESSVQDLNNEITYNDSSYTVSWQDLLLSFPEGSGAPTAVEIPSLGIRGEINDFKVTGEIVRGEVVIN